ncbi:MULTISPECIES: hypothetical protein [Nocardiaceae]|uniref:hypothetical protein n=1 Tax=Nocardiaceae TaxID=85025 RepID=UPI000A707EAE|nr:MULTISPECIES: hypothetical protein [Rhodococcus]
MNLVARLREWLKRTLGPVDYGDISAEDLEDWHATGGWAAPPPKRAEPPTA